LGLSNSAGIFHLDGLNGANTPSDLIIGAPGPGGVYTNANASLAGNHPHNPFANQTATFTLAIAGVLASSTISNVVFSFGTTECVNVPGVPSTSPVPEPASVILLATLVAGVYLQKRRTLQRSV
jgi:PEP-CTERM motif